MFVARLVLALALGAAFALVAVGNSVGVYLASRGKVADGSRSGVSFVPIVGGVAGVAACLVLPVAGAARWAWLPLLLDVGCLPLLVLAALARKRRG